MKHIKPALLLFALALLPLGAQAQVQTGTPPFSTVSGGPDVVDLANLNVRLNIPVLRKKGVGLPFIYNLNYDSSIWYPAGSSGSQSWEPVNNNWGWSGSVLGQGYLIETADVTIGTCTAGGRLGGKTITEYDHWTYIDGNGTAHKFTGESGSVNNGCTGQTTYIAMDQTAPDGSGYTLAVNVGGAGTVQLYDESGTNINPPINTEVGVASVTSSDGNTISVNSSGVYTDTLSTTALTTSGSPPNPVTYSYTGPSGNTETYTVKYATKTVQTKFGCSGIAEFGPTSEYLVSEIDLPDQSTNTNDRYLFTYETTPGDTHTPPYVTGRIATITLPTGGTVTYSYSGGSNGITCSDGTTATLTRTVTPGGEWTYAHTENGMAWTSVVTDPIGDQASYNFQGIYQTERQIKQKNSSGGQTLLKTVYTCYNGASPSCNGTAVTLPISQLSIYTEWPEGQESEVNFNYLHVSATGSYVADLPTEEDDYGYGSGSPGWLLRKVLTSYDYNTSCGVTDAHVQNRPCSVTVKNQSGNIVASTTYSYDANGNLLSETSGGLTKSFTYNPNGTVATATDVNGARSDYNYEACAGAFPTWIDLPLGLTESMTWDCTGGVDKSFTDVRGQTTTYTYDDPHFWRVTQVRLPDGGWKLFSNPSLTETDTYTGITGATPSTGCTDCRHDQTLLDGLGRTHESSLVNDPNGEDTITSSYDSNGRVASVTNPDRSGSATNGTAATTYDALNRPVMITQPDSSVAHIYYGGSGSGGQLCGTSTYGVGYPVLTVDASGNQREIWTDGLGRTIEADEPNGSNSLTVGTCYEYNAIGKLTKVVALATGQTRTYAYDDLGRITSASTPEAGTTTYTYNSSGDLASQKDAQGITTTYTNDALHRLIAVAYSDTTAMPNDCTASNGASAHDCYYYDQTGYNGLTISNGKGRRTGMSDASGETAWSYDAMGRIVTERKTIAGVTRNTSYSYNLDGTLKSLTYPDGRVVNYAYSNAELPTQAVDSDGTNYATSATYWPQGALDEAVHGYVSGGFAGITETWNYNNDLEATSVTATSSAGTALNLGYGYANNGSVTAMNNGLDSGRNESFTYDPLDRILTAQTSASSGQDCWGLDFGSNGLADDALANLLSMSPSKCSGPSLSVLVNSYNQIYSPSGFSYNADGDLKNDGQYTYAWNAANELTSAAGVNYTYDGDSLRVEKSSGTLHWRGYSGQVIEETESSGTATTDYIFFAGRRIAAAGGPSITNGGFEQGATDWWFGSAAQLVTGDPSGAHTGSSFVEISTSAHDATFHNTQLLPVSPGEVVSFGGWAYRISGTTGYARWKLEAFDANENPVAYPGGGNVTAATWTYQAGTYTVPSGVAYVRLYGEIYDATAATEAKFDDGFLYVDSMETFYFADAIGSIRAATNSTGTTCFSADYYPYGQEDDYNTSCSPTYKFTGYEYDSETGNYYAMARYYDPRLGRFMSPDPLGGSVLNPQSLNRYTYVLNDPVNSVDSSGAGNICRGGHGCPPWLSGAGFDPASMFNDSGDFYGFDEFELLDPNSFYSVYFKNWFLSPDWIPWNTQYSGTKYGKKYVETFSTWDQYAAWSMNLAAQPENRCYQSFTTIATNDNLDADTSYPVKCTSGTAGLTETASLGNHTVNLDNLSGFWKDPINWFHKGDSSWFEGFFFDTPHLIGSVPVSAHVDPFGPLNPLHYIIQLPLGEFKGQPQQATCSVNGGCTFGH